MGFKAIFFLEREFQTITPKCIYHYVTYAKLFFFFFGRNNMQRIKWLELKAYGFGLNL